MNDNFNNLEQENFDAVGIVGQSDVPSNDTTSLLEQLKKIEEAIHNEAADIKKIISDREKKFVEEKISEPVEVVDYSTPTANDLGEQEQPAFMAEEKEPESIDTVKEPEVVDYLAPAINDLETQEQPAFMAEEKVPEPIDTVKEPEVVDYSTPAINDLGEQEQPATMAEEKVPESIDTVKEPEVVDYSVPAINDLGEQEQPVTMVEEKVPEPTDTVKGPEVVDYSVPAINDLGTQGQPATMDPEEPLLKPVSVDSIEQTTTIPMDEILASVAPKAPEDIVANEQQPEPVTPDSFYTNETKLITPILTAEKISIEGKPQRVTTIDESENQLITEKNKSSMTLINKA